VVAAAVGMAGLVLVALEEVLLVAQVMAQLAVMELQTLEAAAAVLEVLQPHLEVAALALSSFAIQLHTLMQLHTHQPQKQRLMGIRFIPSLPLEQSPSKE
jgi:hypothetical protein